MGANWLDCAIAAGTHLPIVWHDERYAEVYVRGVKRIVATDYEDGPFQEPYIHVDGHKYRVGACHAYRV